MICAVIPARKSSKRIQNKNTTMLAGKPLIKHTIDFCNNCDVFNEAFISTDCSEIANLAEGKVHVPFLRPSELACDHSIDTDWMSHFISWLQAHENSYSHVMILRPTSPIRPQKIIGKATRLALQRDMSLRSVTRVAGKMAPDWLIVGNPEDVGTEFIKNGFQKRSQDLAEYYYPNGIFDIVKISDYLTTGALYGSSFLISELPDFLVNDIDTIEDLKAIEENWDEISMSAAKL